MNVHRAEVTSLAAHYHLPAVYPRRFFAELGGLLSYGNDQSDNFRRSATYVDEILKGAKPSELLFPPIYKCWKCSRDGDLIVAVDCTKRDREVRLKEVIYRSFSGSIDWIGSVAGALHGMTGEIGGPFPVCTKRSSAAPAGRSLESRG